MTPRLSKVYADVLSLPMGEKRDLYGLIKTSLEKDQEKMDIDAYEKRLVKAMESVLGEPIDYKDRHFPYTTARQIMAWQAMKDGFSSNVTSRFLKKNHTSILWMRDKVESIIKYKFSYEKEYDLVDRFVKAWKYDSLKKAMKQ